MNLHHAVTSGYDSPGITRLLHNSVGIEGEAPREPTPLHLAISSGFWVVKLLLRNLELALPA